MPVVKVEMLSGRTLEQKRALVAALTDTMVDSLGVQRERVQVHLEEMAPENVGIGGVLVSDGVQP